MDEVTKAKLENEVEWRKLMYSELTDLRKDLNTFKIKTNKMILGLTATFSAVATTISTIVVAYFKVK